MSRFLPVLLLTLSLSACSGKPSGPKDGRDVITAMQERYADSWYETLTFVQTTIQFRPGAAPDTTLWWEGIRIPGELRIDIGGPDTGDAMVFRQDSLYMIRAHQVAAAAPTMHPLLILGFDVYGQPAEETIAKLDSLGFDLDRIHSAEWQGRPAWVVGTDIPGDTQEPQFWIDQERLVFVRMTQRVGMDLESLQDIRFDNYQPLGEGWIAPEVRFAVDSTLTLVELYEDIRVGVDFSEGFFEPASFSTAPHWAATTSGE
ncbi:MAG: hypothetical protein O3C45_00865 [Bacteroidetes bacterium]|nr:hypothetical protein [Bacteroidota bacterium]MDA0873590.1 hypothetical protein [Bacteroidota bacterium]